MRSSLLVSTALATSTLLAVPATAMYATAATAPAATAAENGGEMLRVVAHRDVDGDGDRDPIRYRALDADTVRVSVRLPQNHVIRKTLATDRWRGGEFYGATRFNGRRGVELVIGTSLGPHTPWFTVLTYRQGRLVVERSPFNESREWAVDGYANGFLGWYRRQHGGQVQMRVKYANRVSIGQRFTGRTIRYTWRHGSWDQSGTRKISYPNENRASRIGGWHVDGLPRWPS